MSLVSDNIQSYKITVIKIIKTNFTTNFPTIFNYQLELFIQIKFFVKQITTHFLKQITTHNFEYLFLFRHKLAYDQRREKSDWDII